MTAFVVRSPNPRVVVPVAETDPLLLPGAMAEAFRVAVARFGPEPGAPDRYHVLVLDEYVPDTPDIQEAIDRGKEEIEGVARDLRPRAVDDWNKHLRWEATYGPPPISDIPPAPLVQTAPEEPPPSDDALDELFGEGGGAPTPRVRQVVGLLVGGLVAAVVGMLCTAAPGGILVLLSWVVVEKELDRVDSGYLAAEYRPRLQALQRVVYAGVLGVLVLFVVQLYLLCNGTYELLWGMFLALLASLF